MAITYAYEYHPTIAEDLVIRTDPPALTGPIPEDTDVVIYVSLGPSTVTQFQVSHSAPSIRINFG
jgi:beta-lactam-binding protein with PASTA domain